MIIASLVMLVVLMVSVFLASFWNLRKKTDAGFVLFVRLVLLSAILAFFIILYSIWGFLTWKSRTIIELVLFGASFIFSGLILYICMFDIHEGDFDKAKFNKKPKPWK